MNERHLTPALSPIEAEGEVAFWFNALLIASNGTDSRVGSLTADWERFFEWKRIEREDEPRRVSLEVMIRGTCDRARLLDLVENFTLFSEHKAGLVKIIGQNHQFLGVNNAIASMLRARPTLGGTSYTNPTSEAISGTTTSASLFRLRAPDPLSRPSPADQDPENGQARAAFDKAGHPRQRRPASVQGDEKF